MADIAPPTTTASPQATTAPTTSSPHTYPTSLLAGLQCTGNTHLIIGSNPLAAARCTQSLAAGAHPILLAPDNGDADQLHYALRRKVDDGSVRWEKKEFEDGDLFRLGREEVGGVVDAVFVTSGPRDPLGEYLILLHKHHTRTNTSLQPHTSPNSVAATAFPSTSSTPPPSAPSPSSPPTPMAPSKSA